MGDKIGIAYSLNRLGHNALHQADIAAAYALQRESLELLCELGDKEHIIGCLEGIAVIACADDPDERAPRLWGLPRLCARRWVCRRRPAGRPSTSPTLPAAVRH